MKLQKDIVMAYSLDFRLHVLNFKNKHKLTFEETAQHFDLSIRTLFRWSNRVEPCTTKNRPALKIDPQALLEDIEKYPDAYQYERAERFGVTDVAICYALKRLNITCKKNAKSQKS